VVTAICKEGREVMTNTSSNRLIINNSSRWAICNRDTAADSSGEGMEVRVGSSMVALVGSHK